MTSLIAQLTRRGQPSLFSPLFLNSKFPGFGKFIKQQSETASKVGGKKPATGSNNNNNNKKKSGGDGGNEDRNPLLSPIAAGGVLAVGYFFYSSFRRNEGREIDWQTFQSSILGAGEVSRLVVVNKETCKVYLKRGGAGHIPDGSNDIGNYPRVVAPPAGSPSTSSYYFTIGSVESFEKRLEEAQRELGIPTSQFIPVQYANETNNIAMFTQLASTLLVLGLSIAMLRTMGMGAGPSGGPMNSVFKIGKSPAKKIAKEDSKVRFSDVAGCEEAKQEIQEFVEFLKNPKRFTDVGAKIPKGALLYGPPGTGKTLLAKAVAGEASVPFFSISGSDFLEMFVGIGPSRVRDLFANARAEAPCIIFIDEIDAVARSRNRGGFGGNDERENTLNQLLVELDGFNTKEGVVVMGATNRLDILDPAILRPGRFDRQIKVDLPDIQGRKAMFLVHMKNVKIENDNAENVAQRMAALTPGFSGAQIANVVNEAAILAARDSSGVVKDIHFDKAIDRVIGGLEKKNHVMTQEEKTTVAYHEAGHAILGWFLEHADPLLKVTIIPRTSGALGFAQYLPKEAALNTQQQLEDKLCMALGGRAAEELTFGVVTTGAQDDLNKVTRIAYAMVTNFGMSEKVGQIAFPQNGNEERFTKPYSETTAETIDKEVRKIIDRAFDRAKTLLKEHKSDVEKVAQKLLEKETITQHDIADLIGERKWKASKSYQEFVEAGKNRVQQAAANLTKPKEPQNDHPTPAVV